MSLSRAYIAGYLNLFFNCDSLDILRGSKLSSIMPAVWMWNVKLLLQWGIKYYLAQFYLSSQWWIARVCVHPVQVDKSGVCKHTVGSFPFKAFMIWREYASATNKLSNLENVSLPLLFLFPFPYKIKRLCKYFESHLGYYCVYFKILGIFGFHLSSPCAPMTRGRLISAST